MMSTLEEVRRKNSRALAMDLLYLFVTGFFVNLLIRGTGPALIAILPLSGVIYLGYRSSKSFLVAQLGAATLAVALSFAGII